ncbi:MAG TPA: arabinogalactan endo-1,4-beta-galactosidase [Anaerolineales bacterium]|nr:arabinogalactan endo-1,4-beta-galactosidase [Anaerolineales bacterium]
MNGLNRFSKIFPALIISLLLLSNLGFATASAGPDLETKTHMEFAKGFDVSYVKRVEDKGGVYKTADGQTRDVFKILRANGVNYVRFRLWNNPAEGYCSKADVLALAKRARAAGLKIMLDFHYSDFWADPGKQPKPAAWEGLDSTQLNQAVYDYTYDVVNSMIQQGTPPAIVEVGNEITHGMLWPEGHVIMNDPTYDTPAQWSSLAALVNSGIRGVKASHSKAKIMIHIASGDNAEMRWFFDNLIANDVDFDILGLSYYHNWHGTFSEFSANLSDMATRYRKPIIIAETAYPFTLGWNDWTNNNIGLESQLAPGYPATPEGQTAFLQAVVDMAKAIPHRQGVGVFYWGGEWISTSPQDPDGSSWENQALFDFNSLALPAFKVFKHTR